MRRDKAYEILKKHLPLVRAYNGNNGENNIIDAMIEFAGIKKCRCMSCEKTITKHEALVFCGECGR